MSATTPCKHAISVATGAVKWPLFANKRAPCGLRTIWEWGAVNTTALVGCNRDLGVEYPGCSFALVRFFKVEGRLVRTIRREALSFVYDSFQMRNRTHE